MIKTLQLISGSQNHSFIPLADYASLVSVLTHTQWGYNLKSLYIFIQFHVYLLGHLIHCLVPITDT